MKSALLLCLAALLSAAFTGCALWKKSPKPKENPAMAAELEASFMLRWIEKRTGDLVAQGHSREAAAEMARKEFRERYGYTNAGKQ